MDRIIIFIAIVLVFDFLTFRALTNTLNQHVPDSKALWQWVYIGFALFTLVFLVIAMFNFNGITNSRQGLVNFGLGLFVCTIVPKLLISSLYLIEVLIGFGQSAIEYFTKPNPVDGSSRRHFLSQIGIASGALLFGSLVYGVVRGKFSFKIHNADIFSSRIPKSFDGLKIVQLSDAHLGTFNENFEPILEIIEKINALNPDYVVFTGDLVNNHANEALPWIDTFSKIKAKYGKYSIFGNHDYADYGDYTKEEKARSINLLKDIHKKMGFKLMEDEHVRLEKNGEHITLIGVHNWGHGFHQIGKLDKAIAGMNPNDFKILLSHDPSHFDHQVKGKTDIDLTLSGHTHGMQLGFEIPRFRIKWSPVSLRYKKWAGHYEEEGHQLYVNRGFGVIGYPGRLGINPEITLLTLKAGDDPRA